MSDVEKLTRLFAALGASDPRGWAESEAEENLPQLARYRLLRALSQDIQAWDTASIDSLLSDGDDSDDSDHHAERAGTDAERARAVDHAADAERIARAVARETTFSVLYRLADPDSDDLPADLRQQMPGWVLMETAPAGEPTHRVLGALYEDLNTLGPPAQASRSGTVAEGWIRQTNLRPFCESLATEVAYDFDDSDWLAIDTALLDTDDEQPPSAWYTYPLVGRDRVDLHIARSVGGSEVSVSVRGTVDNRVRTRVELLLDIMARYDLMAGYGLVDDGSGHRGR
ncbi:hypothetical protein [Streptomyces sp. NBC_01356]|uniref:hypothetical protein n=1 Tax=Streptomyces sp. NBC_01356 TaxID=2903836 RepID=UPI002E3019C7|nr:hypothetical protein [Streptomyces sp. NBC_01356]